MLHKKIVFAAAGILLFASHGAPVLAQQPGGIAIVVPDVDNYVAGAVGAIPDYLGSDDYTFGGAPAGIIKFGDSERYVRVLVTQLSVNVLDNETWAVGPTANYRFSRDDDVDDSVVSRLSEIEQTVEAGAFVSWKWVSDVDPRHRFIATADFLHDVGGEHEGFLVSGGARYFYPVAGPLTLSGGVATSYASEDYMSTYFGINPADSLRSGLPIFNADSGFRDVRLNAMGIFSLSPNWHVGAGLVYMRLLNDAEDSPVVDLRGSPDQIFAGVGIAYAW